MEKVNISSTKVLRFLAFSFTCAAAVLMNTKIINDAKIVYWGPFNFYVIAFSIASGYNLFVMLFLPRGTALWRLVVALDWIITTLMILSFGMTVNTLVELKMGVVKAGWSPVCRFIPGLCTKVIIALALGVASLLICVPVFLYAIVVLANPFLTEC